MSQQINLFNPVFLKQKKYFSALAMVQALGVLIIGCALMAAYAQIQVNTLSREAANTASQLQAVQNQMTNIMAQYGPRPKSQSLELQIQKTEVEMNSVKRVFNILQRGDIGNTDGYSAYFRAFARQSMNGVWLTGLSLNGAGNKVALQGRTVQPELLPTYINRLKTEEIMRGKSFGTLEMKSPQPSGNKGATQSDAAQASEYIEFSLH
ncbi:MAG: MSHA biogenesis protein MshI [Burkholderiaceae bacterium]